MKLPQLKRPPLPLMSAYAQKTNVQSAPQKIFDRLNTSNIGISFWTGDTLRKFTELSGPLAASNEYQIHYWSLVLRHNMPDGSLVDISVPTVIYNYKQEVSGSHVDFELSDVEDMSELTLPVHNVYSKRLLSLLESADINLSNIRLLSVPMNTLHRHPTGVSRFSSTDLRKSHQTETGIVFPLKTANQTPSFSSIIYNNPVQMVHTEYRIASGNTDSDEGIQYQQGRCLTVVRESVTTPSDAEQLLGIQPEDSSYVINPDNLDFSAFRSLFDALASFEPSVDLVKSENVSKKAYTNKSWSKPYKKPTGPTPSESTGDFTQEEIDIVKKATGVTILNEATINKLGYEALKHKLLPLEKYYYQDPDLAFNSYKDLTIAELRETLVAIQDDILDDLTDIAITEDDTEEVTLDEKSFMLKCFGLSDKDLDAMSEEQINQAYREYQIP